MSSQPVETPYPSLKNWNPVEVKVQSQETLGIIALTIICVMLLMAYLRSQREIRQLIEERRERLA